MIRRRIALALTLIVAAASVAGAQGRGPSGRAGAGGQRQMVPREGLTPRQVQAEFDNYAIDQAQDALQLSDEQYPRFVQHVRALQQVRRQTRAHRARLLMQITALLRTRPSVDDGRIAAATKAVDDQERQALADIQNAYGAVDEVLTPRQRARFRVLEDQLEQKKLDMLLRARQGSRR